MKTLSVVISGGGTGGHLYPALVVGRRLLSMAPGLGLTYVGTRRDVEQKIMAEHGVKFIPMRIEGLKGRGLKSLRALIILPLAFVHSLAILVRTRPGLVIGVGGYSSGPIVLLASWFRVPTVILEQNARPGFTNRLLARWVDRAVVAFPSTLPAFKGKGVLLGNPVREDFYAVPAKKRTGALDVLVFGGSQGSRFLNDRITAALPLLAAAKGRLRMAHQTGTNDLERVRAAYRANGFDGAEVAAYFPGMAAYFGRADLIVSNPPYVAEGEWKKLAREVRDHEPRRALVSGPTGLETIRRLANGGPRFLKKNGVLLVEFGADQAAAVRGLFGPPWAKRETTKDFSGCPRVLAAFL